MWPSPGHKQRAATGDGAGGRGARDTLWRRPVPPGCPGRGLPAHSLHSSDNSWTQLTARFMAVRGDIGRSLRGDKSNRQSRAEGTRAAHQLRFPSFVRRKECEYACARGANSAAASARLRRSDEIVVFKPMNHHRMT